MPDFHNHDTLADAAIGLGLPVFPCDRERRPVGFLAPNGFKDATRDPDAIRRWFAEPGATHIGIPTGKPTGQVVIDVDVKRGARGMEWFAEHQADLPRTRTHRTQTGGLHLIFRAPGVELRNSQGAIAPGIDVRAEGGYIVHPPSPGYVVEDDAEPADMPAWLVEACQRKARAEEPPPQQQQGKARTAGAQDGTPYGLRALAQECDAIRQARFGRQEQTINEAGLKIGGLVAGGELAEGPALADLIAAARAVPSAPGQRPWSQRELEDKARRAFEHGQRRPRQAPPRAEAPREKAQERKAEAGQRADGQARERGKADALRMYPARELMALNLPPLRFVLNELLPVGYTVLAGPPKLGKSWLAYQLALAVASGADLFGQSTWQGEVLYLALEDGERRVQSRMGRLLGEREAPEALCVATKWPRLDKGGFEEIQAWARWRGDRARLCIIDTLAKIKPPAGRAGNAYDQDYELHGQLHALAQDLGIALVNIAHMRKGGAKLEDWLEGVLGSGGITGSADTIIGLQRDRGAADAFLKVTGRDVREEELALRSDDGVWSCLGAAEDVRREKTQRAILDALAGAGDGGMSPREVSNAAEGVNYELAKKTLNRMAKAGLIRNLGGRYARRTL